MKYGVMSVVVAAVITGVLGGWAVQPQPKADPKPAAEVSKAADSVAKLAFLAGTWAGEMSGDPVEETWSVPAADSIIGMFRWMSKGKTTLWEALSIRDEDGKAVLRLRHFDAKFDPWKGECDGVAALKATTVEASKVVFTNDSATGGLKACEYEVKEGKLHIAVVFKDEKRETLKFVLSRK